MTDTAEEPKRRRAGTRSKGRTIEPVREVCPYLLAADGAWRAAQPMRDHRCTAVAPPAPPSLAKQRDLCLRPAHFGCATYLAAREHEAAARASEPADGGLWPETRSAVLALEPVRRRRASLEGASTRASAQALLIGLMVVAFILLAVARATPSADSGGPPASVAAGGAASAGPTQPSAVPTVVPGVPTSAEPGGVVAPSPSASAAATADPSPRVSASASAPASPATAYRVRSGDTLSSIAARFAVTVRALKAANGMTDNVIRPGQVLQIPTAG